MIFGWPLWVIAIMVWCELSGEDEAGPNEDREEE